MAPLSDRIYFPSLEECLSGEKVLLSWKLVATALSDNTGRLQRSSALSEFFSDEYVHGLLKNPIAAFSPPDDASGKDFETKTAPINVTSASTQKLDIQVLKDDAKWLSKNAKTNLVAALRIVIVEHQSRPSRHLVGPLSSQDATNLHEAAGLKDGQSASFLSDLGSAAALDTDELSAEFEKQDSRRTRLFETLLSERRHFMMAIDHVNSIKLYGRLPISAQNNDDIGELFKLNTRSTKEQIEALLPAYFRVLTDCTGRIESGLLSTTDDALLSNEKTEIEWLRTLFTEIVHALSVIFQLVDSLGDDFAPPSSVTQWFSLMEMYNFFDSVQPIHEGIAELIAPLRTLATAVSVIMLKPKRSISYLNEKDEDSGQPDDTFDSYLLSSEVLEQIHKSILNAANMDIASATPAIFTWALLLHRLNASYHNRTEKRDNLLQQTARERFESGEVTRPSLGRRNSAGSLFSIESTKFDSFLENATTPRDAQFVEQLATGVTTGGRVFNAMSDMARALGPSISGCASPLLSSRIRIVFADVLKISYGYVGYQADSLTCLFSLLSPGRGYWDLSSVQNLRASGDTVSSFINDDILMQWYFQQAVDRFPYEFLPFISLCKSLCTVTGEVDDQRYSDVLNLLRNTSTLTLELPKGFQEYELVHEDENTNSFSLTEEIPLITLSSSWKKRQMDDDAYRLPRGTQGRFITDSGRLVLVEYRHSALSLLGRRLEIYLMKEGYQCQFESLQPHDIAEVVELFAILIRMEYLKLAGNPDALIHKDDDILSEASKHISGGKDIVTIVCDTMDYFMQEELAMTEESAINVITACIKFLDAILPVQPSRVWSYLARSELLSSEARAGKLSKLTGSLDLVSERLDFLNSALFFFSNVVDTALASGVQRQAGNKSRGRQQEINPWLGTSDKVLSKVALAVANASVDIFENTSTWQFDAEISRISLLNSVVPLLNKIIHHSYSMGKSSESDNLTSCLRPAASYVIDCFLSPSSGTLRFQPLLYSFISALLTPESTLYPSRLNLVRNEVESALTFATSLLRAANFVERSSTMLESYLFKSSTLLARLCAVSDLFRTPILSLLQALVSNAGQGSSEPPSLLGYLGPGVSKSFITLLSRLGQPYALQTDVETIWKFFSSILRNRQQWMSNCLLTGQTPREAMAKDSKTKDISDDSVFATALSKLKKIDDLETSEALAILDFVASAQNYWPWTVFTLQKDTSYMEGLRSYARALKPSHLVMKSDSIRAAREARLAAYIAETFAMQLYHSRHLGSAEELAKSLVNHLDYYLRDGVEVAGYNKSLHNNFAKNFANKYFGCSVDNFKRTPLAPGHLGSDYYYDLEQADTMLRFDPGWLGRKANGFKNEMELANANLSLVDAQIALFHSWEFLLVELSTCLPGNETIGKQMLQVSQQCLNANQNVPGPESIFLKLVQERANLALILVQRLAKSKLPVQDVNQMLTTLVGTMSGVDEPFASSSIGYYRVLLKALFVTLRAYHVGGEKRERSEQHDDPEPPVKLGGSAVSVTQTVLSLLDIVVGRGFRTLVSLIHDGDAEVYPEDLGLLTAIMQAALSLPTIEQSQTQVLNIMATHEVVNAASSLYSWADQLAIHGDPVYGELAIMFLLQLSNLPLIGEQLACDGILSNLLSAKITKVMLKTNISPTSDAPIAQRCYTIWVKGLLPLMINLLTSLGVAVAPEITYVLNQFSHLLNASVDRFEAPGTNRTIAKGAIQHITLLSTSEIHSLALITRVLKALRATNARDIGTVQWDASGLLENVDYWLASRRLLKERLLPLGQREMEWRTTKVGAGANENVLEAKVVSQLEVVRDILADELE
ncbi:Nucleoporin [Cordyceps fumosorosea ARSEF 2679]|uniref:Nucleoporin NUP188 n=1 Tax=Cordyceps fumosorosea (strain ARSEF 2679) TaxID=1081104 RepID=A0A168CGQ6_CORFA|nr:Nucleoporin [Cordyceps fumosorosea ARSEF 2679]OAA71353.1 Nucleoporin [Cordyceps fumosorosea ARSEF 2679]